MAWKYRQTRAMLAIEIKSSRCKDTTYLGVGTATSDGIALTGGAGGARRGGLRRHGG